MILKIIDEIDDDNKLYLENNLEIVEKQLKKESIVLNYVIERYLSFNDSTSYYFFVMEIETILNTLLDTINEIENIQSKIRDE